MVVLSCQGVGPEVGGLQSSDQTAAVAAAACVVVFSEPSCHPVK